MLITPADLKEYTVFDSVRDRPDPLLTQDIIEAIAEITYQVGHDFSGPEYDLLPETVRLALLKMAQYFALINSDESITKGYTTEKIGDYSYSLGTGSSIQKPDVYTLIKDYVVSSEPSLEGTEVKMRMRSI
ncbi:protein YqbG [Bacillus subtilis]|uniref:protein YqbG n=1 Tax=Bacillus subtilis TaxID=1423 RepID=UPI0035A3C330